MTPKDPIETLLDQERLSEPTLQTNAEAFEAGVRQKIAQRRERRRSFQVETQSDEWADDPFDSWDDEMPADYELVVDL